MQTKNQLFALGLAALGLAAAGNGVTSAAHAAALPAGPVSPAVAADAQGTNTITRLDIAAAQDGTRIVVDGSVSFTPDVRASDRPGSITITVPGAWNNGRSGQTDIKKNGVESVKTFFAKENGKDVVRIVVGVRSRLSWTTSGSDDHKRWEIVIQKPEDASGSARDLFASSGESSSLDDLMDRRAAASAATAGTPGSQVASGAAPSRPLQIPTVSLKKSAAAPATVLFVAKNASAESLREADMAAVSAVAAMRAQVTATQSVAPSVATLPAPEKKAPAAAAASAATTVQPLVATPIAQTTASKKTAIAFPQKKATPVALNPSTTPQPVFTSPGLGATERKISLDFVNSDISEVLKALAVQSGINVILATGVGAPKGAIQNQITVSLHHVSFADALDTVVNLSGYKYARIGNTYAVGTPEAIASLVRGSNIGQMATAAIPFIFSDGSALLRSIESAFPIMKGRVTLVGIGSEGRAGGGLETTGVNGTAMSGAAAAPDAPAQGAAPEGAPDAGAGSGPISRIVPKGGVINVSGSTQEIEDIRSFIEATERALIEAPYAEREAQGKRFAGLETQVYTVRYASAPDLVQILAHLVPNIYITPGPNQGFRPSTTGASLSYTAPAILDPSGNPTASTAPPGASAAAGNYKVDSRTTTLLLTGTADDLGRARDILTKIDVKAVQVSYEAKVVDMDVNDVKQLGIDWTGAASNVTIGEADGQRKFTSGIGTIYRTSLSVSASALLTNGRTKILSNPNLTALDGQTATAFIGDQIKYVTNINSSTTGQNVTTETATVGITLKVTGHTSPKDGTIELYVHPEVSSVKEWLNVGNGISLPQITTRYVDTTIRVKDGETIAIAGLISDTDVKNLKSVPFLSSLPFLGGLFKYHNDSHEKRELVVFITTHVAKD